ncbi:MAG: lytic murein transglycosylase B [Pseudomonadota bacterium]|jgi:membrane-bound lytic murein transglycosylase B|nr:MAG: lytic murein transglycosylase B [Pseudomonadota bacterium]
MTRLRGSTPEMMSRFSLLPATLVALAVPAAAQQAARTLDMTRPEVIEFVAQMEREHGFDRQETVWILRDAVPQPRIVEIMQRPAEGTMAWWEYRDRFLTDERIDGGVRVWREHREDLERVAEQSGVAPQYLVAITGVETFYGRNTGSYRVLDSLVTLAFDYPRRAEYFRRELAQFLLLAREERVDPRSLKGSYAGAMGIAQFMPSSYRHYAADGNGNGTRDLWNWNTDVFASIANYFREHGWRRGEPVLADARHDAPPDDPAKASSTLNETVARIAARGYRFDTSLPGDAKAMLVPAAERNGTRWRVGFNNFYVITRYNRSHLYAMAVNDLADAIEKRYREAERPRPAGPHAPLVPPSSRE